MRRILALLVIFALGCGPTANMGTNNALAEKNKDVLILTTLIQHQLRRTKEGPVDLNSVLQNDTLKRISNSFEKMEFKYRGGYISVYYKLFRHKRQ
jgi:hypothetical protein